MTWDDATLRLFLAHAFGRGSRALPADLTLGGLKQRLVTARAQCAALAAELPRGVTFAELDGELVEPLASEVDRWGDGREDAPADRIQYLDDLLEELDAAVAAFGADRRVTELVGPADP